MTSIIPVYQTKCQTKSWKSYLKEAINDPEQLLLRIQLSPEQLDFEIDLKSTFAVRVPQPFINKMKLGDPHDPLLLQALSQTTEKVQVEGFTTNPLDENNNHTPGLLHKYHGRVLLILSSACAINCRYCFRRHFPYQDQQSSGQQLSDAINYINSDKSITEVILSGGDPLIVSDHTLEHLLERLRQITHLKRLRIHTRLPVVIPQRITQQLCHILEKSQLDIAIVLHINHPNEIDQLLKDRLSKLTASGVQLLNQSVLLKGINNNCEVLVKLSEQLFTSKIMPYYLHQLDKVQGAAHFDVSETEAIQLVKAMRNLLPGYLVPRLAKEEVAKQAKTIIA